MNNFKKITVCLLVTLLAAAVLPACGGNKEHDHVYGPWQTVENSTCVTKGKRKRTCTVCGNSETREADTLPHDFDTQNVCKVCNFALKFNDHLEYTPSADGNSYILSGRGENATTEVVVPYYYEGKPVTEIADECFLGSAITSFSIQNSIKKIGARTFNSCESLKSFYMYDSVEEVGNFAFAGCTSLERVHLSENLTVLDELFYGCTALSEVEIGGKTREITDMTFFKCGALLSLDLPASLEKIGTMAFSESGLVSIGLPSGVTELSRGLFLNCASLERVTLLGKVMKISADQFDACANLKKVIFYDLVKDDWRKVDKVVFWQGEDCSDFTVVFRDGKLSLTEALS